MSMRTVDEIRAAAVMELADLVRVENNVEDREAIQANARALRILFEKRGFHVRLLDTPTGRPALFAESARDVSSGPTLLVYSHYDGVPAGEGWHSDPYDPVLRDDPPPGASIGRLLPWPEDGRFDATWRLVGRSAADSKGSIVAVLGAIDLLDALGLRPGVRLKILLDGEEERESPSLAHILSTHSAILAADAVVYSTGEVHPSGRPTVLLGARGILVLEITIWTASSSAHSGHFGSFVPNAALALCRLLASLKDAEGRVAVEGFGSDAIPLGESELGALSGTPVMDDELAERFMIHRPETVDLPWHHLLCRPTLNVRGLTSGAVGPEASNVVPHRATAELDLRLVAGMDPDRVQEQVERHLRRAGATVFASEPTEAEIRSTPAAVVVRRLAGFPAVRTSASHPIVQRVCAALQQATGERIVVQPTDGGSLPLHLFHAVTPVVLGLPTSNSDNRQHTTDENLQLRFLFAAMDAWATLLRWQPETTP